MRRMRDRTAASVFERLRCLERETKTAAIRTCLVSLEDQ
jgi:hypothetical protein